MLELFINTSDFMSINQPKLLRNYIDTIGRDKLEKIMRNNKTRIEIDPMYLLRYLLLVKVLQNDSQMILVALQQTKPDYVDAILKKYDPNAGITVLIGDGEYVIGYNEIQPELEMFFVYLKKYIKGAVPEQLNLSNYSCYLHQLKGQGELDRYKEFFKKAVSDVSQMKKFLEKWKERSEDCQPCYSQWQGPNPYCCLTPVAPNVSVYQQQMATQHLQPQKVPMQMQTDPIPMKIITNLNMEEDEPVPAREEPPESEPEPEPVSSTKPVPDIQDPPPHVYEERPVVQEKPMEAESPWGRDFQQPVGNPFGAQPQARPKPVFVSLTNPKYNLTEEDLLLQQWFINNVPVNTELAKKFNIRMFESMQNFFAKKEADAEPAGAVYISKKQKNNYEFDLIIIAFIKAMVKPLPEGKNPMVRLINALARYYKNTFSQGMELWNRLPDDRKAAIYAKKDDLDELTRQLVILSEYKPKNGN